MKHCENCYYYKDCDMCAVVNADTCEHYKMNCNKCIYENLCVIKAFPDMFENTQWEKEPCDHFKNKADFVEAVRCKDCKYVHFNTSSETYFCRRRGHYSEGVQPTDFCSYGERRDT